LNINEINLINFRNYKNTIVKPSSFNILYGNNAQGKSNLIEAIYYLGNGVSFRTNQNKELIKWDSDYLRVEANCQNENGLFNLKSVLNNSEKRILIDDIKIKKLSDLFSYISVCIFEPDDLALIKGNPSKRRNFIDRDLVTIYPLYYDLLKKFNNVNYQRNTLLKYVKRDKHLLCQVEDWTDIYKKLAYKIVTKRIDFLTKLKPYMSHYLKKITQGKENIDIIYEISQIGEINVDLNTYLEKLDSLKSEEIEKGNSIFGPHRDDFNVYINGYNVKKYGSQGQQRTVALCLKLSYLEIANQEIGEYPILLLDDVMSELDLERRIVLTDTIKDNIQTFITTTDLDMIKGLVKKSTILKIEDGNVVNISS